MIILKLLVMLLIAVLGVAANTDRRVQPPNRVPRPMPKPEVIRPLEIPTTDIPTEYKPSTLPADDYHITAVTFRPRPRPIRPRPGTIGLPAPTPINSPPTVRTLKPEYETKNPYYPSSFATIAPSVSTETTSKPESDIDIRPNKDQEDSDITNPTLSSQPPESSAPPTVPSSEPPPIKTSTTPTLASSEPSTPPQSTTIVPPLSKPLTIASSPSEPQPPSTTVSSSIPETTTLPTLRPQLSAPTKAPDYSKNTESIAQSAGYPNKQPFERYPPNEDKTRYPNPHPPSTDPPPPPPFTQLYKPQPTPPTFTKLPYHPAPSRPSKPSETIKYDSCRPGVNSFFPIMEDCGSYIECRRGAATKLTCPDGLLYNTLISWPQYPCSYSSEVRCENRPYLNNPQPSGECPRQYGYFPRNDGICDSYILCQEGRAQIMKCPSGLAFNAGTSSCDWPANVPSCNLNVFKGFKCPPAPVDEFGVKSDNIYNFRYNNSCKEYVACHREYPRLLRCDQGLAFDETLNSCTDADFVKGCNTV